MTMKNKYKNTTLLQLHKKAWPYFVYLSLLLIGLVITILSMAWVTYLSVNVNAFLALGLFFGFLYLLTLLWTFIFNYEV